ncbi:MAG: hypothetical protein EB127_14375 [Alphaproteobacteria bacterium]|nr:hypothetical protein [Alphaproteobacteria bacterium]
MSGQVMHKTFVYDCRSKKENPEIIVRWLRRNFGERGKGWDWYIASGKVCIEIAEPKFVVMYELCHG